MVRSHAFRAARNILAILVQTNDAGRLFMLGTYSACGLKLDAHSQLLSTQSIHLLIFMGQSDFRQSRLFIISIPSTPMQRPPLAKKINLNLQIKRSIEVNDRDQQPTQLNFAKIHSPQFRSSAQNFKKQKNCTNMNAMRGRVSRKSLDSTFLLILNNQRVTIHKSPYQVKRVFDDVIYQKQQSFIKSHKELLQAKENKNNQPISKDKSKEFGNEKNSTTTCLPKKTYKPIAPAKNNNLTTNSTISKINKKNMTDLTIKPTKATAVQVYKKEQKQLFYKKIRKINGSRYIVIATIDQNKLFSVQITCMQNHQQFFIKIPLDEAIQLLKTCFNNNMQIMMDNVVIDEIKQICYLKYERPRRSVVKSRLPLISETAQQFQESVRCVKSHGRSFCQSSPVNKIRVEDIDQELNNELNEQYIQ